MPQVKGKADGKAVNTIIKELSTNERHRGRIGLPSGAYAAATTAAAAMTGASSILFKDKIIVPSAGNIGGLATPREACEPIQGCGGMVLIRARPAATIRWNIKRARKMRCRKYAKAAPRPPI